MDSCAARLASRISLRFRLASLSVHELRTAVSITFTVEKIPAMSAASPVLPSIANGAMLHPNTDAKRATITHSIQTFRRRRMTSCTYATAAPPKKNPVSALTIAIVHCFGVRGK